MGLFVSVSQQKGYLIFLNLSFISVGCVFCLIHIFSSESKFPVLSKTHNRVSGIKQQECKSFLCLDDYKAKCFHLNSSNPCVSQGYIDYLHIFYCNFGSLPLVGYFLLFLWLLVLFYLLGNTASEYFCSSLESLSKLLKLSPTIAGVTLLSLGNGAPDVFSSLVAFMGEGTGEIGLNTVLGGASFVTCVVLGVISISLRKRRISVNRSSFIRDVCFFILVLFSLILILINGQITLWGSIAFSLMYVVYVIVVYTTHIRWKKNGEDDDGDANSSYESDLRLPILNEKEKGEHNCQEESVLEENGNGGKINHKCFCPRLASACVISLYILEMPLYLPRKLTIPVISEEKWSKPFAIASVTLAPLLLSAIWTSQNENFTPNKDLVICGVGLLIGVVLGFLAFFSTEKSNPPRKCLFPWLVGGFMMSITWSYIIAQELVGLLVSIGYILGISPSILGLTVLAWGNSLGDFVANLTMALNGGREGAQIAVSGCYAGPIFNTLFGLGLSLVGASWHSYPSPVVIPNHSFLLETWSFLAAGLLWALLILPRRGMRLDGVLGGGLFAIYFVSLFSRLVQTLVSFQENN